MKIFVEPKKLPSKITKLEFVSLVSDMGRRMKAWSVTDDGDDER